MPTDNAPSPTTADGWLALLGCYCVILSSVEKNAPAGIGETLVAGEPVRARAGALGVDALDFALMCERALGFGHPAAVAMYRIAASARRIARLSDGPGEVEAMGAVSFDELQLSLDDADVRAFLAQRGHSSLLADFIGEYGLSVSVS